MGGVGGVYIDESANREYTVLWQIMLQYPRVARGAVRCKNDKRIDKLPPLHKPGPQPPLEAYVALTSYF